MSTHYIFGGMCALSVFLLILLLWAWIGADEQDNERRDE